MSKYYSRLTAMNIKRAFADLIPLEMENNGGDQRSNLNHCRG